MKLVGLVFLIALIGSWIVLPLLRTLKNAYWNPH